MAMPDAVGTRADKSYVFQTKPRENLTKRSPTEVKSKIVSFPETKAMERMKKRGPVYLCISMHRRSFTASKTCRECSKFVVYD